MNNKNDMNYTTAFKILEIDLYDIDYTEINLNLLKKKYHKLALQNHPDKNGNTIESKEHFQQINEAYSYLKREIKFEEEKLDDNNLINITNKTPDAVDSLKTLLGFNFTT